MEEQEIEPLGSHEYGIDTDDHRSHCSQFVSLQFIECLEPGINKHVLPPTKTPILTSERTLVESLSAAHCDSLCHELGAKPLRHLPCVDLDIQEVTSKSNNALEARQKRRILLDAQRLNKRQNRALGYASGKRKNMGAFARAATNQRRCELDAQRRNSQTWSSSPAAENIHLDGVACVPATLPAPHLAEKLHAVAHSSSHFSGDLHREINHGIPDCRDSLVLSRTGRRPHLDNAKKIRTTEFRLCDVPLESLRLQEPILYGHCQCLLFQYERKGLCCSNGQIVLKSNEVPDDLYTLFVSESDESREFKRCIRIYNSSFAFTSLGVNLDKELCSMRKGVYTFRAQGQVYHRIRQLVPSDSAPSFLQLYFYDTEHELEHRLQFSDQLLPHLVSRISHLLQANPYCQFFRSLKDIPDLIEQRISIRCDAGLDQRIYNAPTAAQVAALWVDGRPVGGAKMRDIVVTAHSGDSYSVNYWYGCYDPLQYPLLFPFGDTGYHLGIRRNDPRSSAHRFMDAAIVNAHGVNAIDELLAQENEGLEGPHRCMVSCREYYCYRLQIRPSKRSLVLHAGRLFQQYIVDMYVKIETSRLDFFRRKQREIQADLYQGIIDSLEMGCTRGSESGRRIILPSSFIGGPRDMRKRYMDAMSLVQTFGKPDIFLTVTCNPNWPEIKEQLHGNDLSQDRPDLVSRIFRAKIEELKHDLFKKRAFGQVAAYVYVIEFQKRGLPHAHFLLILERASKLIDPDKYDGIVTAEIPFFNINN